MAMAVPNASRLNCYYFPAATVDATYDSQATNAFTAVANAVLSLIATCGNAFVIFVVVRHREERHVPYNVLLGCLALSDLMVGLVAQPALAIHKIMEIRRQSFGTRCTARVVQSCSGWLTSGVSLFTLCAISLDRYLALKFHLRYASVVTATSYVAVVIGFWVFAAIFITLRFFVELRIWMLSTFTVMLVSIVLILSFYAKIFQVIRRHRRQIHARNQLAQHFHGRTAVEAARHRRSAVTMMYVLGAFIVCFVPCAATIMVETIQGPLTSVRVAYDFSATIVFLSSSLNPFLYCWRIGKIRQAALKLLKRGGLPSKVCANADQMKRRQIRISPVSRSLRLSGL